MSAEEDSLLNGGGQVNMEPQPPLQSNLQIISNLPTMFGTIQEKNIAFCIDTSGSMINSLDAVKEHLREALTKSAQEERDTMFNLIEFNTEVTLWSDKLVRCTPQTVAVATQWINNLQPKTGTNTMDALMSAFSDPSCEAIYLVTDGLPDQHPTDILDSVVYASQNRPIHCYYIQDGNPDNSALEFLQDLAMETYGSFHVITVAQHGRIERITPIYRAEMSAERIIRTSDGAVYPSNYKQCSMTTTLNAPPALWNPPAVMGDPWSQYPWNWFTYPYRWRHLTYLDPVAGWSRYRPSRAVLRHGFDYADVVPGAGATLIGTRVLARRNDDGYFYLGTVKSEILSNKFLVEFGPCKHGKYKDTVYQETFIYDIVSHGDALRHAVLPQDRVLVPWEPEGERYGPGVVLEGQERRAAEGGGPDQALVVSFNNGKSLTVPAEKAVWIPTALHERITFELQLPTKVRREFAEQEYYPEENYPGYPTSGPRANPAEYETVDSHGLARNEPVCTERGYYRHPFYVPTYPVYYKYHPRPSFIRSEDVNSIIPGTELTKSELNEKVMSQLMFHKMKLEDKKETKDTSRLLQKRGTVDENSLTRKSTEKSVRFDTHDSDIETELDAGDLEQRDSGRGSATDLCFSDEELLLEEENDAAVGASTQTMKDVGVGTNSRLFYRQRRRRPNNRPPWRYWNNETAPELMEPMNFGPYRRGPYEETYSPPHIERRNQYKGPYGVEWSTSGTQYVDPFATYKYDATVRDSMYQPRPPSYKPEKQGPGTEIGEALGGHQREQEQIAQDRRDYRRHRTLEREQSWQEGLSEKERMTQLMEDHHRQCNHQQLERDRDRHQKEYDSLRQLREAKKQINEQLCGRIEDKQAQERDREDQRQAALQAGRARREEISAQRNKEIKDTVTRRQEIKQQRVQERNQVITEQLLTQDSDASRLEVQRRSAKINRIHHYRQLEEAGQRHKNLQTQVTEQQRELTRSRIFP